MVKLSAIALFSIFILFLAISILFSRFLLDKSTKPPTDSAKEGFIAFEQTTPELTTVMIPQYSVASTSVVKLHDNIYFDTKNANLIEVDGAAFDTGKTTESSTMIAGNSVSSASSVDIAENNVSSASSVDVAGNVITSGNSVSSGNTITKPLSYPDMTGSSITGIYVITRDGNTNANPYTEKQDNTEICESLIPNVQCQYSAWIYTTKSKNTNLYQVLYISWYLKTYIHIIQIDSPTVSRNIASFIFDGKKPPLVKKYDSENSLINSKVSPVDTNVHNDSFVLNPLYDDKYTVYQVSQYVQFDLRNANLILNNPNSPTPTVYNRTNTMINDCPYKRTTVLQDASYNSWVVGDHEGNTILYMTQATITLVVVIQITEFGLYQYNNVVRFTQMGVDSSATCGSSGTTETVNKCPPKDTTLPATGGLVSSNSIAPLSSSIPSRFNYDDYILKTQIVPAACGACANCPYCSNTGTCTSCRQSSPSSVASSVLPSSTDVSSVIPSSSVATSSSSPSSSFSSVLGAVSSVIGSVSSAFGPSRTQSSSSI